MILFAAFRIVEVTGSMVPENAQCLATPNGPFNLTGSEFFSLPASAQAVRIRMPWSRLLMLCNALRPPGAPAVVPLQSNAADLNN